MCCDEHLVVGGQVMAKVCAQYTGCARVYFGIRA